MRTVAVLWHGGTKEARLAASCYPARSVYRPYVGTAVRALLQVRMVAMREDMESDTGVRPILVQLWDLVSANPPSYGIGQCNRSNVCNRT